MSNSEKGTKNSGTDLHVYIINLTKSEMFPRCAPKNVELIGAHIGGSADPLLLVVLKMSNISVLATTNIK